MKFRKKPIVVNAIQWLGGSSECLDRFCGNKWTTADAVDLVWDHKDTEEVVVYNSVEKCWLPVPVGSWIIRGVMGELYPCEENIFSKTYEAIP